MKDTLDVREIALQRAIKYLGSIGASYKIITKEGAEYGDLQAVRPKKQLAFPLGSIRDYIQPFLKDMAKGDVVEVPVGQFDLERLQSNIGAYTSKHWGARSVITRKDTEKNVVEVLRVEG